MPRSITFARRKRTVRLDIDRFWGTSCQPHASKASRLRSFAFLERIARTTLVSYAFAFPGDPDLMSISLACRRLVCSLCVLVFTVVFAGLPGFAFAQTPHQIADGIYQLDTGEDAPQIRLVTGKTVGVGDLVASDFGTPLILSVRNDNSEFSLRLREVPAEQAGHQGHYLIIAAGHALHVGAWGSHEETKHMQFSTSLPSREIAADIAASLNTELVLRAHPGHMLQTTWTPTQERFALGDDIKVRLQIKNVGETKVRFFRGGQQRGERDNQFRFIARSGHGYGDAISDTGNPMHRGGLAAMQELSPGDTFSIEVSLDRWFRFEKPDTYLITGIYEIDLYADEDMSNPLWSDFATGDGLVTIAADEAAGAPD